MKKSSGAFRPCNGAWGEHGSTNVHLESVTKKLLKNALQAAKENALSTAKKKRT
jgi:hypothetical protein